jgi:hypothetical protein
VIFRLRPPSPWEGIENHHSVRAQALSEKPPGFSDQISGSASGAGSTQPSSGWMFSSMAMSLNSLDSKTSPHSWHSTNSASSSRATTRTRVCRQGFSVTVFSGGCFVMRELWIGFIFGRRRRCSGRRFANFRYCKPVLWVVKCFSGNARELISRKMLNAEQVKKKSQSSVIGRRKLRFENARLDAEGGDAGPNRFFAMVPVGQMRTQGLLSIKRW